MDFFKEEALHKKSTAEIHFDFHTLPAPSVADWLAVAATGPSRVSLVGRAYEALQENLPGRLFRSQLNCTCPP